MSVVRGTFVKCESWGVWVVKCVSWRCVGCDVWVGMFVRCVGCVWAVRCSCEMYSCVSCEGYVCEV